MAQAGYTPIQLYYSSTTTNAPTAGNLASGELAINITDGKLFYKDNGGVVQVIAWKTTPTTAGGTGLTSWTAGDLPYYATGTTLSKLGIGTNGQVLTSTGTAPQWSTLSGVAVTTFSAGTTGFTPSVATSGAITLAGTLATTNGGTGLTSFTANGVVYASSSSALTTGSALTFDGTTLLSGGGVTTGVGFAGKYTIAYTTANPGSRSWRLANDVNAYGDFSIQQSTTQTGSTYRDVYSALNDGTSIWSVAGSEQMRLTSTGLGIGTSSPGARLSVVNAISAGAIGTSFQQEIVNNNGATVGDWTGTIYRWSPNNANCNQAYIGAVVTSSSGDTLSDLVFGVKNSTTGNTIVEAMRIRQGNLGLGVTPSAWVSSGKALQVGNSAGLLSSTALEATVTNNCYLNSGATAWIYLNTAQASRYQQYQGVHSWYTAGSGTAGNAISFTQAMTLDASGNLGVGTTSLGSFRFKAFGTGGNLSGNAYFVGLFGDGSASNKGVGLGYDSSSQTGIVYGETASAASNLAFWTYSGSAWGERARITSGGDLLVGTTTSSGVVTAYKNASGRQTVYYAENASTAADAGTRFRFKAGTQQTDLYLNSSGNDKRFYIENNGSGVYLADGGTSWTNTSDIREKVVIEPIVNAAQKVSTLNAFIGRFKVDAEDKRRVFLSAQDVLAVLPEAVDATDENKLGLSYTDTIPLLVAAIQEQQTIITDLRARVAQLEAK